MMNLNSIRKTLQENTYLLKALSLSFQGNQALHFDAGCTRTGEVSADLLSISLKKTFENITGGTPGFKTFRTNSPIPRESAMFYFEAAVLQSHPADDLTIGLAEQTLPSDQRPGLTLQGGQSFGFHSTGNIYNRNVRLFAVDGFKEGDVVGIGVNLFKKELFFTLNGAFINKIVQLSNLNSYYPTVSFNSMFAKMRLNFGTEPFYFNFEMYVQSELAGLIQEVDAEKVDVQDARLMVQQYMLQNGLSKSYLAVSEKFGLPIRVKPHPMEVQTVDPLQSVLPTQEKAVDPDKLMKESIPSVVQVAPAQRKISSAMSEGPESSIQETSSGTLSVSGSTNQLLPKKSFRKSADSASRSEAGDPTKFAERSLLRTLLIGRKVSQARKYFEKVFSHLQKNLELSAFFTAHEFICLVKETPVAAALYAKANFGPELRDRHILIYDAQKKIITVTVKVADP